MPEPVPIPKPTVEEAATLDPIRRSLLESEVVEVLRSVYDPEIPVNIYDLGLIYDASVDELGNARVLMTLTSPACPVAETLPGEVEDRVRMIPGLLSASVELTWDPPFSLDRVSDDVKLMLGLL